MLAISSGSSRRFSQKNTSSNILWRWAILDPNILSEHLPVELAQDERLLEEDDRSLAAELHVTPCNYNNCMKIT